MKIQYVAYNTFSYERWGDQIDGSLEILQRKKEGFRFLHNSWSNLCFQVESKQKPRSTVLLQRFSLQELSLGLHEMCNQGIVLWWNSLNSMPVDIKFSLVLKIDTTHFELEIDIDIVDGTFPMFSCNFFSRL